MDQQLKINKHVFENGCTLLHHHSNVPDVSILVGIPAGAQFETVKTEGIFHFLEHMCFRGNKIDPEMSLKTLQQKFGNHMNGTTGIHRMSLYGKIIREDVPEFTRYLLSMLWESTLDKEAILQEKGIVSDEIRRRFDSSDRLIHPLSHKIIYKQTPIEYGSVLGSINSVTNYTEEELFDTYRSYFNPINTTIVMVGGISFEEAISIVKDCKPMDSTDYKNVKHKLCFQETTQLQQKKSLITPTKNTSILVTQLLPKLSFEEYLAFEAIVQHMSHRMFQEIRNDKGYAYSARAWRFMTPITNKIGCFVGTSAEHKEDSISIIENILKNIYKEGPTNAEVQETKHLLKRTKILARSDTLTMARGIFDQQLEDNLDNLTTSIEMLENMKPEFIREVAAKYLDPNKLTTVSIGPEPIKGAEIIEYEP